jgi:hypothetical protein
MSQAFSPLILQQEHFIITEHDNGQDDIFNAGGRFAAASLDFDHGCYGLCHSQVCHTLFVLGIG